MFRIFAARAQAEMERIRAEESVRRSEERLASVLASAMDAIITIDKTRHITLFNDAAERIFGYARSWAIGQPFDRFLSKPFRQLLDSYLQDADRSKPRRFWAPEGMTAVQANHEEFPIEATFSPVELGANATAP